MKNVLLVLTIILTSLSNVTAQRVVPEVAYQLELTSADGFVITGKTLFGNPRLKSLSSNKGSAEALITKETIRLITNENTTIISILNKYTKGKSTYYVIEGGDKKVAKAFKYDGKSLILLDYNSGLAVSYDVGKKKAVPVVITDDTWRIVLNNPLP
jgi:hypothetical protein